LGDRIFLLPDLAKARTEKGFEKEEVESTQERFLLPAEQLHYI